jgi:hypothetical protein
MTTQSIASASVAREISATTSRFFAKCRNPHDSRVSLMSKSLVAPLCDVPREASLHRVARARARSGAVHHRQKFFSQGGAAGAREDRFRVEIARISVG